MSFFFSCSCFPLETHLQSKGKTFQVAVAEYRSNLEGCKWLHCEALKGSKEEERKRAREQESERIVEANDSGALMIRGDWEERRRGLGAPSFFKQFFKRLMVRAWAVNCYGFSSFRGSYSNRDKQTVLPRKPSQEVELLWPGAPLCWSRQCVFYYVNISLKENLFLRSHIRNPIEFTTLTFKFSTPMCLRRLT